jgi:2-iminobutanoate/2-iminopropanoate deaminase
MEWKVISTDKAPKPLGPYSQAIVANGTVYVAGLVAIDPSTGNMVQGGVKEQTWRIFESMKAILEAAGSSLDKVTKVTVYLKDGAMFRDMNEVYSSHFINNKPARTTIVAEMVRPDILVEIDAIAVA